MDEESDGVETGPWAWSRHGDSISPEAQRPHGMAVSPVSPVHRRLEEAQKFAERAEEMRTREPAWAQASLSGSVAQPSDGQAALHMTQLDLKHVTTELLASKENAVQLERRLQHEQIRRVMELKDAEERFQVRCAPPCPRAPHVRARRGHKPQRNAAQLGSECIPSPANMVG